MIIIGGITLAIGEVGEFIPLAYLGLLGFIPMMMGVLALWKLFRRSGAGEVFSAVAKDSEPLFFCIGRHSAKQ